ncbi:MAG: HEAT repeat domain-containing protein [Promethearchaeota archaeon]|nr:MAG: HEAT repeat domain-containing protein [Candidatus Lokiarchaeota archaeon]
MAIEIILLIVLLIVFILAFVFGFYIIYRQVALVKKGEFRNKDRIQCIFYAIIFSLSIMLVFVVAVIYTVQSPEFWDPETTPPDVPPLALLFPFMFCLIYISFYPIIDFLFIALSKESDEGLTPFHKFLSKKIINKSKNKLICVLIALFFYLVVFILPPILLSLIGMPFILIWITWMLVYPLIILTFYGSKGYIAGISNAYYHIPDIRRSIFLNFEDSKRGMKQFKSQPVYYIVLGLMLFVYIWAWISLFQTIIFFFTRTLAISTMSSIFVFVTLLFGILGYFTRFWGRKIKYRGIDIYFAAYLMASIGINVLVNFLIVNPAKLLFTFNLWALTNQIVPNYFMFAWAAVIEEIVLLIFTSYYFLARNNEFINNIKYSKITECGQTFDPIPLFNLIKHHDPKIKKHALETLVMMFERIPLKNESMLNDWKFKNSLLDGICDYDGNLRRICNKILVQLENDVPEIVLPWIIESLESPNYDKSISITKSLLKANLNFIEKIPVNLILNLTEDPEWRLRLLGLKLLGRLQAKRKDLAFELNIKKLINDPNSKIGVEILNILAESSYALPIDMIIDNIFHTNNEISAAAIKSLKNLDVKQIDRKMLMKIVPLIKDPSSSVRASIFEVLAKIGNFKKHNLQLLPFLDGLIDPDKETREAAINVLEKYFEEEPNLLDIDSIINKIDTNNFQILNSVVSLLGRLWSQDPEKILTTFIVFIKFEDEKLKNNISNFLIENSTNNPNLVIQNIIKIPDVSKFLSKGIISQTLINIGKRNPKQVIPNLMQYFFNENDDVRLNALNTIDGLIEEFLDYIDTNQIFKIMQNDKSNQVKKKAISIISKIALEEPTLIQPFMSDFLNLLVKEESSIRIVLSKSILDIAKESPEIIPVEAIKNLLDDQDSFVRETSAKILGLIGYKAPLSVIDALINKALIDDDWIVREAAALSLGEIINHVDKKGQIIEKLVSLINDDQNWVRRSAMNILSNIKEVNNSHITFNDLKDNLTNSDSKVREASARLIRIFSDQIEEIFDKILSLLEDESKEVRTSTIDSFIDIIQNVGLNRILNKLLQNLSDEGSLEIQRSIALILERTTKYENEKIKKRVISLLKIRCEMSQDPIICGTVQKLKEN